MHEQPNLELFEPEVPPRPTDAYCWLGHHIPPEEFVWQDGAWTAICGCGETVAEGVADG